MTAQDYYQVLGISKAATHEEIRRAYRLVARKHHPDNNPGDKKAKLLFMQATEAHEILSDRSKRRRYDRGFDPIESVQDHFRRDPSGRRVLETMLPSAPVAPQLGIDLVMVVEVDAEILKNGGAISITTPEDSQEGQTELVVEVPSGADQTAWCRLKHLGAPGRNGADHGDLWLRLVSDS